MQNNIWEDWPKSIFLIELWMVMNRTKRKIYLLHHILCWIGDSIPSNFQFGLNFYLCIPYIVQQWTDKFHVFIIVQNQCRCLTSGSGHQWLRRNLCHRRLVRSIRLNHISINSTSAFWRQQIVVSVDNFERKLCEWFQTFVKWDHFWSFHVGYFSHSVFLVF